LPVEIVTTKDETKTIYVPPNEYFPLIALPAFDPPAHVSKKEYKSGIQLIGVSSTPGKRSIYQERLDKFLQDHDAKEIAVYSLRFPTEWGRMLAKAAYAFSVHHYGLEKLPSGNIYVLDVYLARAMTLADASVELKCPILYLVMNLTTKLSDCGRRMVRYTL
jgi:hypothetical protein